MAHRRYLRSDPKERPRGGHMPFRTHILVLANRTVDAAPLMEALEARGRSGPIAVTLLVPARLGDREEASGPLDTAVARLRDTASTPRDGSARRIRSQRPPRKNDTPATTRSSSRRSPKAPRAGSPRGLPGRSRAADTGAVVHHVLCPPERPVAAACLERRPQPAGRSSKGSSPSSHVDTNDVGHPYG